MHPKKHCCKQCSRKHHGSPRCSAGRYVLLFVEHADDPESTRIAGYYDWTDGNDIAFEPSQVLMHLPSTHTRSIGSVLSHWNCVPFPIFISAFPWATSFVLLKLSKHQIATEVTSNFYSDAIAPSLFDCDANALQC